MIVRDRRLKKSEYRGRDCEAKDELCPCRECYQPHDTGRGMRCIRRDNHGCPNTIPLPVHDAPERKGSRCRCCAQLNTKVVSTQDQQIIDLIKKAEASA